MNRIEMLEKQLEENQKVIQQNKTPIRNKEGILHYSDIYKSAMDTQAKLLQDLRMERELAIKEKKSDTDDFLRKKEAIHKIALENQEMKIKEKESIHRMELERDEFELKAEDTMRRLSISENESDAKVEEIRNKPKQQREDKLMEFTMQEMILVSACYVSDILGKLIPRDHLGLRKKLL